MTALIPTLDYSRHTSGSTKDFAREVQEALGATGFFLLQNHGISEKLLAENRRLFARFFRELPLKIRLKYSFPGKFYQQGYTPPKTETGEHARVPDHKHFWQFGDANPMLPIDEIPELKSVSEALYDQFNALYRELMQIVAVTLELPKEYFDGELGNSIIRHIHYPGHEKPVADDGEVERGGNIEGMCASRHTDINDLTLLHATEPGLQLRHGGEWIPVHCGFETLIVNTGDMLWHLTGGRYRSGEHRVVCEPGTERFSSPFFGHRLDHASVVPLSHLGESDRTRFHFQTEGEFLNHRLEQIGLKAKS